MTLPPSKRRRRLILSDDDEPAVKIRRPPSRLGSELVATLPERNSSYQKRAFKNSKGKFATKTSPKSSPEKGNKRASNQEREGKSLHVFFGRATEEQRWAREERTPPFVVEDAEDGEAGDAIEDDSLDEAFAELLDSEGGENRVLDRRKTTETTLSNGVSKAVQKFPGSSQRFAKPSQATTTGAKTISGHDDDLLNRPWAERFAPTSLAELAVHKKKVADVQTWLSAVLQGQDRRRLLVLKGPAGSGKTTTISLLSEVMGFDISEWRSPTVADPGVTSLSSQFEDFINRGGAFGTLDVSSNMSRPKDSGAATQWADKKRILLAEEFPSTMTLSSSTLASFRNILSQYLAAAVPPRSAASEWSKSRLSSHPPIVLIVSESLLTSATASTDSFTAHRLLGPDLCNHPYATMLEFNPIAPTLINKALELAIKKEARVSKSRRILGSAILNRLSDLGDVRSAINGLEFLCLRSDTNSDRGGRTAAKTKKSNKTGSALTDLEKESLELVTQREASLGIFHAVGKVVWNKREDQGVPDPSHGAPSNPHGGMSVLNRPKVSQVDIDELLNEIGTDIQTFTAALHENYVLSTNGPNFTDTLSNCIDFLSESDLLSPGSRQITSSSRSNPGSGGAGMQAGGGVDMLRQNEISFHLAVRGLLFSLPSPVRRAPHASGKKGDSFKMFYPASLKLWKPREEIHDLVSLHVRLLSASGMEGLGSVPCDPKAEGVESWKSRSASFLPALDRSAHNDKDTTRVWASRDEVLLERLPYMARTKPGNERLTPDIIKITQLTGMQQLNVGEGEDAADEENAEAGVDLSAADETTDRVSTPPKRVSIGQNTPISKSAVGHPDESAVEKMYISDDDIEDD